MSASATSAPGPRGSARAAKIGISLRPAQKLSRQTAGRSATNSRRLMELPILPRLPGDLKAICCALRRIDSRLAALGHFRPRLLGPAGRRSIGVAQRDHDRAAAPGRAREKLVREAQPVLGGAIWRD